MGYKSYSKGCSTPLQLLKMMNFLVNAEMLVHIYDQLGP